MDHEVTIMQVYEGYINLTNQELSTILEPFNHKDLESMIRKGAENIYSTEGQTYKAFARWLYKWLGQYTRFKQHKFDIIFNILYYKEAIYEPESKDYYKFVAWLEKKICKTILKRGK